MYTTVFGNPRFAVWGNAATIISFREKKINFFKTLAIRRAHSLFRTGKVTIQYGFVLVRIS